MRLNVFTFNQVNLQRACGYQAVVVSGGSGAVRLSLHSLLQWRAVTACSFCLGILQRFCLFFYDIRGGFFSPLSSVLLILPLRDVSGSVYVRRWRKFPVVLRPVRMLWVCVVVGRSSSRTSRKIVLGLRTLHLSLLVVLLAVLQLVSFPLALRTSDSIFRLGHGSTLAISSAYRRYPSSIGIGLCAAVLRLYPFIHRALRGVRSFRLRCFRAAGPFFLCKMFMPFHWEVRAQFPAVPFQSHVCVVGVLSACRGLRANLLSSVFGAVCLLLSAFHMAAPYFVSFLVALLTSDSMFERGLGAYVSKPRLC